MLNRTAICVVAGALILFSSFFVLVSFSDIAALSPSSFPWSPEESKAPDNPEPVKVPKPGKPAENGEPIDAPKPTKEPESKPADESEAEDPEPAPAARVPGCGKEQDWIGQEHREFKIKVGGRERTYYVLLPRSYDPDKEIPAVFMFAPRNTDALRFDRFTGLSNPLVNPRMITVYPVPVEGSWEGAPTAPKGVNDREFTAKVLEALKDEYCIKTDQVFATGHSNGAGFVNYLACSEEYGKGFGAFAPVAGTFYTDVNADEGCDVTDFIRPMLEVHGDTDKFAKFHGGMKDGQPIPDIPQWIERWAERNACDEPPQIKDEEDTIDKVYTCGGIEGAVRHLILKGSGHGWPGIDGDGKFMKNWITPTLVEWFLSVTGGESKKE